MICYSFQVDTHLRITGCDRAFEQKFAGEPEKAIGEPYAEFFAPIVSDGQDMVAHAIRSGSMVHLNGYNVRSFSGSCVIDITIAPVSASDGTSAGARIEIAPASHQTKQAPAPVDVRKLAVTLAHGIRNPLNAIKGAVVYLQEKYAAEQTLLEFTRIMEEEIARLDAFISRFLGLSTEESELVPFDVNDMLRRIRILTSLQAKALNIGTSYAYGDVPPGLGDPFHIEQAVLNLINNSMNALSAGGALAVESSRELADGAEYVVITVSDNGTGIMNPMALHVSLAADGREHGYGLFIAREVIRAMGGRVEIKSEQGAGTSISLYLQAVLPMPECDA